MNRSLPLGCACCGMSRRNFVAGCAACAAGLLGSSTSAIGQVAAGAAGNKFKIRVIYSLHGPQQKRPDWPNVGFDFVPVMEQYNSAMARACPDFEFIPTLATGPDEAGKILEDDKNANIGGYVVFQMNCWNRVVQTIAGSKRPVLYADFAYAGSGGFLVYTAAFLRAKSANVGFVSSTKMEDLLAAVKCFAVVQKGGTPEQFVAATAKVRADATPRPGDLACKPDPIKFLPTQDTVKQMKASKILAVKGKDAAPATTMMEIPVIGVTFAEVNDAWKAADKDQARAVADRWQKNAAKVDGVSRETLETSAAMYIGMKAVLQKHGANAITINCLGGFYGGHIHAYPCLGFHELCNEGLIGACEADVRSTATMVSILAMTQGRPGYISDPVIDTARRQIIYAHCVASNRVFGPAGTTNPYEILTHSEDRQGASLRSIMPVGYMTTTLEIQPARKQILFHQAKAVDNDFCDRACRTKLAGEPVGDLEKLFTEWDQWGWHRVTAYGDLKEPVFALAEALGWTVLKEA